MHGAHMTRRIYGGEPHVRFYYNKSFRGSVISSYMPSCEQHESFISPFLYSAKSCKRPEKQSVSGYSAIHAHVSLLSANIKRHLKAPPTVQWWKNEGTTLSRYGLSGAYSPVNAC